MYNKRDIKFSIILIFGLFILLIIGASVSDYMTNKKVIENRDKFFEYDNCYMVKNHYYCR